jgi:hypothetical protein
MPSLLCPLRFLSHLGEIMTDLELIMAEAPTIKVKTVKERKVREKNKVKRSKNVEVQSRTQRSMNPRRR